MAEEADGIPEGEEVTESDDGGAAGAVAVGNGRSDGSGSSGGTHGPVGGGKVDHGAGI